ncbi:MAG: transcriptional regulator [Microthrixaceae bacterium]
MGSASNSDTRVARVAVLELPLRRDLYRFLCTAERWVSRDEASDALGIGRPLAAFHLEKLADAGILEISYERRTGRTGPGAGRPSKLYRPAGDEVAASVPDRHYDLAGAVLATAVAESIRTGSPIVDALREAAREAGGAIVAEAHGELPPGAVLDPDAVADVLQGCGYEPRAAADGDLVMSNCPFHRLAERERDLVCHLNLDLIEGVLDSLGHGDTFRARLEPESGRCCVRVGRR